MEYQQSHLYGSDNQFNLEVKILSIQNNKLLYKIYKALYLSHIKSPGLRKSTTIISVACLKRAFINPKFRPYLASLFPSSHQGVMGHMELTISPMVQKHYIRNIRTAHFSIIVKTIYRLP